MKWQDSVETEVVRFAAARERDMKRENPPGTFDNEMVVSFTDGTSVSVRYRWWATNYEPPQYRIYS